jgi:hypothetical protein
VYFKKRLFLVLVFLSIVFGSVTAHLQPQRDGAPEWALVERDTIQTRNLVPVVNHAAMLVNMGQKEIVVSIQSPFPKGKYLRESPFTAFGNDSLLGAPMFAPFSIPIKQTEVLGKPEAIVDDSGARYIWNGVKLLPQHAVIAQYDSYYGPKTVFFEDRGMNIAGIKLIQRYSVEKKGGMHRLIFRIDMKNIGTEDIEEMFFRLFVPNAVLPEKGEPWMVLVEPVDIWSSANLSVSESSIIDGFTRAARGIDASVPIGIIEAGKEIQFVLQMDIKKKAEKGAIYPIMNILGRRKSTRIWPVTRITGALGAAKRFHYLFYNLVIADRFVWQLDQTGLKIVKAESFSSQRD